MHCILRSTGALIAATLIACNSPAIRNRLGNADFRAIAMASCDRSGQALEPYLGHSSGPLREAAAIALADIQDTAIMSRSLFLLRDPLPEVRSAFLHALGQGGAASHVSPVRELLRSEGSASVRGTAWEALGKLSPKGAGLPPAQSALRDSLVALFRHAQPENDAEMGGWARGTLALHRNGADVPALAGRIPLLITRSGPQVHALMAYVLRHTSVNRTTTEENLPLVLNWLASARDPEVCMHLIAMTAPHLADNDEDLLIHHFTREWGDDRICIAAAGALARIRVSDRIQRVILDHPSDAVAYAFLSARDGWTEATWNSELDSLTRHRSAWVRAQALRHKAISGNDPGGAALAAAADTCRHPHDRAQFLRAMADVPALADFALETSCNPSRPPVERYAATEALTGMAISRTWKGDFTSRIWLPAWHAGDMGTRYVLASWATPARLATQQEAVMNVLRDGLRQLDLPRDLETYNAIADALTAFGEPTTHCRLPEVMHPDWERIAALPAALPVHVSTTKGDFTLTLYPEDAPVTVGQLTTLIASGFYTGKFFHRIVPNFVAQTGCPRGDGMGSTDPLLRTESARHAFRTGSMGMASAGRDTESCQWFVTLAPAYSLEGRYTCCGEVTAGMEVLFRLQPGDRILEMHLVQ